MCLAIPALIVEKKGSQARADVAAASAKQVDAQVTFERTQNLFKERAVSKLW